MNLLLITHKYWPEIGGTAVMAERTATALRRAGHRVTVLTTSTESDADTSGVTFLRVKRIPMLYVFGVSAKALLSEEQHNFDYIILNDLPTAKSAALSFTRSMLSKTIVIVHGSEPENVFLAPSLLTRITLFRWFYKRLLAECRSVIAFSSFMKEKLLRHLPEAGIEQKTIVCRKVLALHPMPSPDRAVRAVQTDRYIVLTVSRILERKGFRRMARIMSTVILKDRRIHWNIVGSGSYEASLRQQISALSLNDNVTFLGEIREQLQLSRCYESANVLLLLSEYEEGLGLVYLEAAAHGLPSIANDKSGERESVKPYASGFLVTRDEEVIDIILHRRAEPLRNSTSIYDFASTFDVKHLPDCIFALERRV